MAYDLSVLSLSAQLEAEGLSRDDVGKWMNVCYPRQIELVRRDFAHYTVQEQLEIGLRGARGLKPGVLKDRQAVSRARHNTIASEREAEMRRRLVRQDPQALADEFL